jgi:hypothetical protein
MRHEWGLQTSTLRGKSLMGSRGKPDLNVRPKCNPIQGELPVLQYCALEQLKIDESYQRSLDAANSITLIRRIATFWDWGLCQPLYVARRSDGALYVVDGQHRLAAARLRGDIWQLPCVVRSFESAEQEAAAFVALNQERRPLSKLQIFKAAIAAGDFEASQIVLAVKDAGLSIASTTNLETATPGALSNVGGLQNCYRVHGVQVLTTALQVLAHAYPGAVLRYAGTIFPGIVALVAGGREFQDICKLVGSTPQPEWVKRVIALIAELPSLNRKIATERVFIAAAEGRDVLVEFRQSPAQPSAPPPVAPIVDPTKTYWCAQCDRRVGGAQANKCSSPFCSVRSQAAA